MNDNGYFSHSENRNGHKEPLLDHLTSVASRAALNASFFDAITEAKMAGLLHDLGKYGVLFQKRLVNEESGIDHWSAGAWAALTNYKSAGLAAALAIQGHHIGLQVASADAMRSINPAKLQEQHPLNLKLSEPDIDELLRRLSKDGIDLPKASSLKSLYDGLQAPAAAAMLDIRMLYSALVDADYIATEAHFKADPDERTTCREEGMKLDVAKLLSILLSHVAELAATSTSAPIVNSIRADLFQSCLNAGSSNQGTFTLTAPTGAGKTLSMLAFALKHALKHDLRRIVMVIPYLSIIEQTAHIYKNLFEAAISAEYIDRFILEHHSLACPQPSTAAEHEGAKDMENEDYRAVRLLSENWDAPIVITTSVQFFESLFSNRPFACRKLHNLSKSVILFDEVQTLPTPLAVPTLASLSRLAERYGATVVFSTATQPAFPELNEPVKRFCVTGWQPQEIVSPQKQLFRRIKRQRLEWPQNIDQPITWPELAERVANHEQALCIVNVKRHAHSLLDELERMGIGDDLFHLSTNMCPAHRRNTLQEIRRRLRDSLPCLLISTQCIEAGVDVDFPTVYRAMAPLEAIAQAAGRCNRNGLLESGNVVIFVPEEAYPDPAYRQATSITKLLYRSLGSAGMDIDDPTLFTRYYREVYDVAKPENQNKLLQDAILRQDFVDTARHYYLIPKASVNVLVPYDLEAHENLASEVRIHRLTKGWMVKAATHAISIYRPKKDAPISRWLEPVPVGRKDTSDDWFIYLNKDHYHKRRGLMPPESLECIIG
ncbi:MAG: CRISPR-associated endonuclease Cas3'' [Proteobacteria bacterium]|nr:CRISPR-associated endonuclease Cas3'' [Pseudomonadota bacterium]